MGTTRNKVARKGFEAPLADKIATRIDGLSEALRFERFLSELSTAFVRITADGIDDEIEQWLERVALAQGIDRASVGQIDPGDGTMYCTHQWSREGVIPTALRLEIAATLPWLNSNIMDGRIVVLPDIEKAPADAAGDLEYARRVGCKSHVSFPLKIGGAIVGAVAFDTVLTFKRWSGQDLLRLGLLADVFGNALERKRGVQEFRRLENEIGQFSSSARMGELTVSLAHELNQPLGAILNNAQAARRILSSGAPDLEEVDAALDDIVRDNSRAVDIIKQVRALFQRGDAEKGPVDIEQVLRDVQTLLRHDAITRGISLRLIIPDRLAGIIGQRTQLTQLLINLVINAFDAVDESGSAKREVEIRASQDTAGYIRVAVVDSGRGIDPAHMTRIFEAFFTSKKHGIGLGLSLSRSIVEKHGGRLWARQDPGQGATFIFELPLASCSARRNS